MLTSDALLHLLDHRLAGLRRARPELADALDLQDPLIRASLTSARPAQTRPFALPREQLASRIRVGTPLLHDQPVHVDVQFAGDLFNRLVDVLRQRPPDKTPTGLG